MAKKQIIVSDISGKELTDGDHAQVVITHARARYTLDAHRDELDELLKVAHVSKMRGRRPKVQANG